MDAKVAEKVMHWTLRLYAGRFYWFGPYDGRTNPRMDYTGVAIGQDAALAFAEASDAERFAPTTDIAAAWQVAEHLKDRTDFGLYYDSGAEKWSAVFVGHNQRAETAPLAICRAALAAVGAEVPA